jgi:ferric-dicitrate binding protein FerR (iron transport regulator)
MLDPRIPHLIAKHLSHTISESEREELDEWINASPASRRFMETRMRPERVLAMMKARAAMDGKRRSRTRVYIMRWSAAAAVVVLLVTGVWYFQRVHKKQPLYGTAALDAVRLAETRKDRTEAVLLLQDGEAVRLEELPINTVVDRQGLRSSRTDKRSLSLLSIPALKGRSSMPWNAVVAIPFGQSWHVTLPGGTEVDLAPGTSLAIYRATDQERTLALDGEAFFQVVRNVRSPLAVLTGNGRVDVLGTTFNILDYSNEDAFSATLISGAVRVSKGPETAVLKPGEEATTAKSFAGFRVAEVDTTDRLAWRSPYFIISDRSIRQVMQQVSRWYGMNETIFQGGVDTVSKGLMGGGHIGKDMTLPNLLKELQAGTHLFFEIRGKSIVVSPDEYTSLPCTPGKVLSIKLFLP